MIVFKLGEWQRYFEGGVSLATYQQIGRIINRHGPLVRVELAAADHVELHRALTKLETGKSKVRTW